jgi:CoA:oxalate CoA-transferase
MMLAGVRVIDLTGFLAGPYCTQILGDLGADVIKVESPEGDLSRRIPPHFVGDDSAYFLSTNRNKRSVVMDLKNPAGQETLRHLCDHGDVLIESFRPGVLQRLGLTYEEASARNPRLVWCSITGFGGSGAAADRPAYDMIVQAESGVMSITGDPDAGPVRTGPPLGDLAAGMYAAVAINGALVASRSGGRGQRLEISMYDCQLSLLSYLGAYYLVSGRTPGPQGRGHDSIPTYRTFTAGDGRHVVVTAVTQPMWERLCAVLDVPELAEDGRFLTPALRHANREELWRLLEERFADRAAEEWVADLQAREVPAALIRSVGEALDSALTEASDMTWEATAPSGKHVRLIGNPIKSSADPREGVRIFPPALGQDTSAVLHEVLGLSDGELERLSKAGAFGAHADTAGSRG